MGAKPFVLDTSALLAFIEKEDGAERVRQVLGEEEIILPWLVVLEVVYISQREMGETEALTRFALLKQLNARMIWSADEPTLLTAARLKASHRLSLADAIIAAFAIQTNATLLHKDPEYEALSDQVSLEALPYKNSTEQ